MTTAFDTLKLGDRLESAGFTPQQARGTAAALSEAFTADVATKADLNSAVDKSRLQLEAKIADAKADFLKWVVGAIGFQTLVVVGAMKMFMH